MSSTPDRRTVLSGIAWTTPAVLLAVATPAVAGSQPPPPVDTNPCTNGTLTVTPMDKWQKGSGGSLWQTLEVYNNTDADYELYGRVEQSSAHLLGVGGAETYLADSKNSANFVAVIPAEGTVIMNVFVTEGSDNDSCWLYLDACGVRYHMKTLGKNDRIQ